ncbi:uncharacterized protein Z518_05683 [Rhinocladiella mackenziei CBS 650.93]|uniref:Uncharacterized protein n=1 Tax=Rhinocladiella mackenziei CBS 650.93 TaxID=1442369 RepID=A0A0D2FRL4_9EURO|nr:uncharacterized protein Z518_05683 [Rhinocladiella mackenziei CBS 650.93]KIX04812.1 hypothetical protein Z518_05683 [Rhinocladiella mackenziei CBS 650.93]
MNNWWDFIKQTWPPRPKFTEKELSDQAGKVFIVTGSTSGVGRELARILYSKNAKVYVAARSPEKATKTIDDIKTRHPSSTGAVAFLRFDFEDLTTIRGAATEFLSRETRLDVLWNNAAVLIPPKGSKTKQGFELQLGVNTLAPFLFTKFLTPILVQTAKISPPGSVRVMWVSSSAAYLFAPTGGVEIQQLEDTSDRSPVYMYGVSKAGNAFHCLHFAKLHGKDGIISTSGNPGNLRSGLQVHIPWWGRILTNSISYDPIYGAYTELFGGLSPDIDMQNNGAWIIPWGRIGKLRQDLAEAGKSKDEGGSGLAEEFWKWCEEQVKEYL